MFARVKAGKSPDFHLVCQLHLHRIGERFATFAPCARNVLWIKSSKFFMRDFIWLDLIEPKSACDAVATILDTLEPPQGDCSDLIWI